MTQTVVVGDIHGQYEIVDKVVALGMPTVFVGDFLDSWTRSPEDCVRAMTTALSAPNTTVLYGNHERSYLNLHMRCSGHRDRTQVYVNHLRHSMQDTMEHYVRAEGFLISHAGISQRLLDATDETLEEYLSAGAFDQIGRSRGGYAPSGGLYWCDWDMDFVPVEGTSQIVGHTRGDGVRELEGNYCIDCLENHNPSVVFIEDGKLEVVPLEDI